MKRLLEDVINELLALQKEGVKEVIANIYTAHDIRNGIMLDKIAAEDDSVVLSVFERNYEDGETEAYDYACQKARYCLEQVQELRKK